VMARRTCDEWVDLLARGEIPCGPVNNMQSLFADPQVLHRRMVVEVPHPIIGTLRLTGVPVKYSDTPATIRRPPPLLGEHTDEVLEELLGRGPAAIADLRRRGAIGGGERRRP